jgi:hypothetical protein
MAFTIKGDGFTRLMNVYLTGPERESLGNDPAKINVWLIKTDAQGNVIP